jgi:hypothetical protein
MSMPDGVSTLPLKLRGRAGVDGHEAVGVRAKPWGSFAVRACLRP